MSELLKISGLSKSYRSGQERLRILVDLNLSVELGQMVAITGASGSGKSTFLHLVGGMERPEGVGRVPEPDRRLRVSVPLSSARVQRPGERHVSPAAAGNLPPGSLRAG